MTLSKQLSLCLPKIINEMNKGCSKSSPRFSGCEALNLTLIFNYDSRWKVLNYPPIVLLMRHAFLFVFILFWIILWLILFLFFLSLRKKWCKNYVLWGGDLEGITSILYSLKRNAKLKILTTCLMSNFFSWERMMGFKIR